MWCAANRPQPRAEPVEARGTPAQPDSYLPRMPGRGRLDRGTGPGAPGALACTWSSGWVRSSAGTAGRSWRLRALARRAWRTTWPVRPAGMSPARPGRPWRVSRAWAPGPAWKMRAAVLICPRRSPGPWTGCSAGAWSARASSARPIRRAPRGRVRRGRVRPGRGPGPPGRGRRLPGRGQGGVGLPGLSPGITRRPIQRRSGTGRPGQVPPGPMRPAWMPSGLVRLRGEPAG